MPPECQKCHYCHGADETCEQVTAEIAKIHANQKQPATLARRKAVVQQALTIINELEAPHAH